MKYYRIHISPSGVVHANEATGCVACTIEDKPITIQTAENVSLTENLFNFKRWFNGLKQFSAVKLIPPHLKK